MSDLIPLSLYIHVPWCERKCPYCDFNSHENKEQFNESAYISALLDDLEQELHYAQSRPLQSIFIGGGTPSLFSADSYQRLLKGIEQKLPFAKDIEITLEANPGSSEREKFQGYRTAGVNRLSIGIQSFDADKLKKIGRIHNQQDALQAAIAANDAGFDNFNLDLMYALPQQTLEQAISDVQTAISLQPSHLSCYQLTLEPNTTFYRQPPQLPNSDQAWAMQKQLQKELAQAGFMQYEVSAYAHQKRYCRHNLNYWQYGDYLGIGAGAHGKISQEDGQIVRYWKQKHPKKYLQTAAHPERIGETIAVDNKARNFEFMLNALRLKQGFSIELFEQRTQQPFELIQATVTKQCEKGLLQMTQNTITPTERGYGFIDSMLNDYL